MVRGKMFGMDWRRGGHGLVRLGLGVLFLFMGLLILVGCRGGKAATTQTPFQTLEVSSTFGNSVTPSLTVTLTLSPSSTPSPTITRKPTKTSTATKTPTPTATPTSFIPATLTPSTPEADISAYRLRGWTESDGAALVDRASGKWQAWPGFLAYEILRYVQPFQHEYLLRFPESSAWKDMAWQAASFDPQGIPLPGMQPGQDLFEFLIENWLNQDHIVMGDLSAFLKSQAAITVGSTLAIHNLFGDGQDATMYLVTNTRPGFTMGDDEIIAIHQEGGAYKADIVMGWTNSSAGVAGWSEEHSMFVLDDVNGNGLPEIAVIGDGSASGLPHPCWQNIWLYEWRENEKRFVNLAERLSIFNQDMSEGPCKGKWEFGVPDTSGSQPLILSEYLHTPYNCPDLEIQRTYRWDGQQYNVDSEIWMLPQSDEPACKIAWAYTAIMNYNREKGWQDDRAIAILDGAVKDWPETMDESWGPASQDYFRLQLAIWHDLRGEGEQALALLQLLAMDPIDPQFNLPTRLAGVYLEGRSQGGVLGACMKAQTLWETEIQNFYDVASYPQKEVNFAQLKQYWGFASTSWVITAGNYIYQINDLCKRDDAITAAVFSLRVENHSDLKGWFDKAGVRWYAIEPVDINGDGNQDWLAVVERYGDTADLWAFLYTSHGWTAKIVDWVWSVQNKIVLEANAFSPNPGLPQVTLIQVGNDLEVLVVAGDGQVNRLLSLVNVVSYQVENDGTLTVTVQRLDEAQQTLTYIWNTSERNFTRFPAPYDFDASQLEAECLLFQERDFLATVTFIEKFLAEAPAEPRQVSHCGDQGCQYYPDWYHPYLRYLLGVTYELSGSTEQAVQVYYGLWRDYPETLFGMAAALKLELVQP